jgi:microcystin-dependent protein
MADPFLGEIRIFAGNFAPTSWALCNGQLMAISQNTALFSILGTQYGGDGKTTFALPNLQGNAPMHQGQGPGLSVRVVGETGGATSATLIMNQMAIHTHSLSAASSLASGRDPTNNPLARSRNGSAYGTNPNLNVVNMSTQAVSQTGGSQPHNNMQPYLGLTFIIALAGIFPPRS